MEATYREYAIVVFNQVFNEIEETIQFNMGWIDSAGDLDNITSAVIDPGCRMKTTDIYGRRAILIGTRFGTVAVHELIPNQNSTGSYVCVFNESPTLLALIGSNIVAANNIRGIIGKDCANVGRRAEVIFQECAAKILASS